MHEQELLLLDEPFAGLDPLATDVMLGVLKERRAESVPVVFSSHQLDLVEAICDLVGILRQGRMIACGTVEELRATTPPRLEVEVAGAGDTWAKELGGVRVTGRNGPRLLVELCGGTDDQTVLRAALAAGPVRHFARRPPSLAEIFREAMEPQ